MELGELGMLVGRPRQIVQVMVNLLVNAGHATAARRARCACPTHREARRAAGGVRDTGTGMTRRDDAQPLRALLHHQACRERARGWGWRWSHGIITAHGGRIEVVSQPGQGACFTVHLPRVPPLPNYRRTKDESLTEGSQPLA